MKPKHLLAHSILWAAAIVASAMVGAPAILSTVLLPTLGATSLIAAGNCRRQPETPVP